MSCSFSSTQHSIELDAHYGLSLITSTLKVLSAVKNTPDQVKAQSIARRFQNYLGPSNRQSLALQIERVVVSGPAVFRGGSSMRLIKC